MARSARLIAWCAIDLGNVSLARRTVSRLTRLKRCYRLLYPALLAFGAGVLASCAGGSTVPPQAAAVYPVRPQQEPPSRPRTVPRPERKPAPSPPAESAAPAPGGEALAVIEPKPSAGSAAGERPSQAGDAAGIQLIGLDEPAATRLFGSAAERSEEPPATVWRYKSGKCELDLFFYLDLRSGRMRTLHYALKDGAGDAAQRQNCLRSLIASRAN